MPACRVRVYSSHVSPGLNTPNKIPRTKKRVTRGSGPWAGGGVLWISDIESGVFISFMSKNEKAEQPAPPGEFRRVAALCNPSLRSGLFFLYLYSSHVHTTFGSLGWRVIYTWRNTLPYPVCVPRWFALMSPLTVGNLFRAQISAWPPEKNPKTSDIWWGCVGA